MISKPKTHRMDKIMPTEEHSVSQEIHVHGRRWETIHGGYFSDPEAARPLVEAILQAIDLSHPEVIADLGGGTGFILKEILRRRALTGVRLVNVDLSLLQLQECRDERITPLQASVAQVTRQDLTRQDLAPGEGGLLLIARGILHYFSRPGQRQLLKHLRAQQQEGELFVHHTSCFQEGKDAQCLSLLYEMMGTQKWYGTLAEMKALLEEEGWSVSQVRPAPKIPLDSRDLAERYSLSPQQITSIREEIDEKYGQRPEVFTFTEDGFRAWLHANVFSCKAV
jgi:trans-aconitate methyltransferase